MVTVLYSPTFEKTIRKMKDGGTKERLKAQIKKIVRNPGIGKSMRYSWKQTREVYIPPFRLSYCDNRQKDILIFLALYQKDDQ